MKITRKQLKKIISESFIGAPDGKVYTQQTKRVHSEEGEAFGDGSADEMDIPVVYGEDVTSVATPKLYEILTQNSDEIHSFHAKGPELYKILMNPETSADEKKYFLTQLYFFDIISEKELDDAQLEIDLLTSPDFEDFRDQSAERLRQKHQKEIFPDIKKDRELYKNPQYVEWAKKQIDKAVAGGFEYFKDAVEEQFFYHMYDYKYKGYKLSKLDYNPDEGIDPEEFASLYVYEIGGMLGGYKGFRSTEDAALYNDRLDDYTNDKSHKMILIAIDALVDAGILEKTDDGKVRMPARSYEIIVNNRRGRKEDYYKETGKRTAFPEPDYVSSRNLPVVTEAMIRQVIREAFEQRVPIFPPVTQGEMDAMRQKGRQAADLSNLSAQQRANLQSLSDSEPNLERYVFQSLGSTEPSITTEQEAAFLAGQDLMLSGISEYNVRQYYGEIANHLNSDQIKILTKAAGKTLRMALAVTDGAYFYLEHEGTEVISPSDYYSMHNQIFKGTGDNPFDIHLNLVKKIIGASKKTFISVDEFEDLGIGEFDEDGYYFYDSDFSTLDDRHKITIDNN